MTGGLACPACGRPFAPGHRHCAGCGGPLARSLEEGGGAACAVHPTTAAVAPCPRCGTFACPECLVAGERGDALCRACLKRQRPDLLPWDRRHEEGVVRAYWRTSVQLIQSPAATFGRIRPDGSLAGSFGYALLSNLVGLLTTGLLYALLLAGFGLAASQEPEGDPGPALALGMGAATLAFFWLLGPLVGAGLTIVNAALDHLVLKLVGASPGPWTVTMRGAALSMAPYLVGLVPLCGLYLFPLWALVLRVFAYRGLHRTSGVRAAVGALAVPVLGFLLTVAMYVALVALAVSGQQE